MGPMWKHLYEDSAWLQTTTFIPAYYGNVQIFGTYVHCDSQMSGELTDPYSTQQPLLIKERKTTKAYE